MEPCLCTPCHHLFFVERSSKMKKKYVSKPDTMNVYQFMLLCGLKCDWKKNIKISHEIMSRKLGLRSEKIPSSVIDAKRLPFFSVVDEEILTGKIIAVLDDYNKVLFYKNPKYFSCDLLLKPCSKIKKEKNRLKEIRQNILNTMGYTYDASGKVISLDEYNTKLEEACDEEFTDYQFDKGNRSRKIIIYGRRGSYTARKRKI